MLIILSFRPQFVSHPYSQLLLNAEIYRGIPTLKRASNAIFFGVVLLLLLVLPVLLPVLPFIHVFCPQHKLTMMLKSPQIRFLTHVISYLAFVVMLIQNTTRSFDELFKSSMAGKIDHSKYSSTIGLYWLSNDRALWLSLSIFTIDHIASFIRFLKFTNMKQKCRPLPQVL